MNAAGNSPPWLPATLAGAVSFAEPLARHTSWHVGGPADVFFKPQSAEDLALFLAAVPASVPVLMLGLGSNILVRDGGWRGVVISMHGSFDELRLTGEGNVYAEAGVPCARLAKSCARWGIGPAEFFAGIPGTVGGALAMNAGAWGGETWPHVCSVEVINRQGVRAHRLASEYRVSYRHVEPPVSGEWYLSAEFRFTPDAATSLERIQQLLEQRRESQPIGKWSGGSTFVNPPGDHAARLIDAAGLKGFRIGGAVVSEKHANFLLNEGAATANDLECLINHVSTTVSEKHGIRLVTEVRVVGEPL